MVSKSWATGRFSCPPRQFRCSCKPETARNRGRATQVACRGRDPMASGAGRTTTVFPAQGPRRSAGRKVWGMETPCRTRVRTPVFSAAEISDPERKGPKPLHLGTQCRAHSPLTILRLGTGGECRACRTLRSWDQFLHQRQTVGCRRRMTIRRSRLCGRLADWPRNICCRKSTKSSRGVNRVPGVNNEGKDHAAG